MIFIFNVVGKKKLFNVKHVKHERSFSPHKSIELERKVVTAAEHYGSMRSRRRHDFILAGPENGRFLLGTYTCRWE